MRNGNNEGLGLTGVCTAAVGYEVECLGKLHWRVVFNGQVTCGNARTGRLTPLCARA